MTLISSRQLILKNRGHPNSGTRLKASSKPHFNSSRIQGHTEMTEMFQELLCWSMEEILLNSTALHDLIGMRLLSL